MRVRHYSLRPRTGGDGIRHGGNGLRRDVELLAPGRVTVLSERRRLAPGGAQGGAAGAAGENWLLHEGKWRQLTGKFTEEVTAGDVISIRTPGGGGWGNARS